MLVHSIPADENKLADLLLGGLASILKMVQVRMAQGVGAQAAV